MKPVAIELDVLGDTRPLWNDWLEDAARRFRSISPLDPAELPEDRAAAAEQLDDWAKDGVGDWRAALGRFAEDRAPVYLRPDADISAALRELAAQGHRLGVFTDAPEALARIAVAQLGADRRIEALESGAGALERLLANARPRRSRRPGPNRAPPTIRRDEGERSRRSPARRPARAARPDERRAACPQPQARLGRAPGADRLRDSRAERFAPGACVRRSRPEGPQVRRRRTG